MDRQAKKTYPLAQGFEEAREVTQEHARSFYFALQFLRKERRYAVYAVYALCRMVDNLVDDSAAENRKEKLEAVQESISAAYERKPMESRLFHAFQDTVLKYEIPRQYFDDLIDGMRMDLFKNRYETFSELREYCYRVAGVIGLIMVNILGYRDESVKQHAVDLGIAMQLTNILRDVKEDYERGRIYLPQDELRRFGITDTFLRGVYRDNQGTEFIKFQISRARFYYREAARVVTFMKDMNGRFVVKLMKELYAEILDVIEKNNFDISRRAYVNGSQKIYLFLKVASTCPYFG